MHTIFPAHIMISHTIILGVLTEVQKFEDPRDWSDWFNANALDFYS
jgi:hypothetical protein